MQRYTHCAEGTIRKRKQKAVGRKQKTRNSQYHLRERVDHRGTSPTVREGSEENKQKTVGSRSIADCGMNLGQAGVFGARAEAAAFLIDEGIKREKGKAESARPSFKIKPEFKTEKAGPSHKPSLFFTALGAVLFGRRRSASLLVSSPHKRRPCWVYSIQN